MRWLELPREDEPEEIDDQSHAFADIATSMGDVARSNRVFGGTHAILSQVSKLLKNVPAGSNIRILDIATGSADIPKAITLWGRRAGLNISVVGVDNNPLMLRLAQDMPDGIHLIQANALALPFPPASFDIAICALAFHHLGFTESAHVLKQMDRLTTRGFIVTDLRRDLPTYLGVKAALSLIHAHPFTRHDGPASVKRAFTPQEYRKMVGLSGVQGVRIYAHLYYRMVLVQAKC